MRTITGKALLEVVSVVLLALLSLWAIEFLTPLTLWEKDNLGQPFLWNAVFLILLPLLILNLSGRNPGLYGISFDNLKRHLDVGFMSLIVVGTGSGLVFPLIGLLGTSPREGKGALILAAFYCASLPLVALLLRKKPAYATQPSLGRRLAIFLLVSAAAFALSMLALPYTNKVSGFVYAVVFVGFGEELLFRGYVQGRLNEACGRPYKFLGVNCGAGLVITALLFAMMHALASGVPLDLWWGLWTFCGGLLFGFLREKTGGIVAPAIAHGIPESIPFVFLGGV